MDIKLHLSPKNIGTYVMRHLGVMTLIIILCFVGGIGYFLYANVYQTLISPAEIDKNEIIAKKQKVNLDLFTTISNTSRAKKEIPTEKIDGIANPF